MLGDGADGRVSAMAVDVFAVDVLGFADKSSAFLTACVTLFEAVQLEA